MTRTDTALSSQLEEIPESLRQAIENLKAAPEQLRKVLEEEPESIVQAIAICNLEGIEFNQYDIDLLKLTRAGLISHEQHGDAVLEHHRTGKRIFERQ